MAQNISLSTELSQNIDLLHRLLPLGKSFDLITRDLRLGGDSGILAGDQWFLQYRDPPADLLRPAGSSLYTGFRDPRSPRLCAEQARLCTGIVDLLCG